MLLKIKLIVFHFLNDEKNVTSLWWCGIVCCGNMRRVYICSDAEALCYLMTVLSHSVSCCKYHTW